MGRPKGVKDKEKRIGGKHYEKFGDESFSDKLRKMKSGDYLFSKKKDNVISGVISVIGMKGEFTTERVVIFYTKSHGVEEGVMIRKI